MDKSYVIHTRNAPRADGTSFDVNIVRPGGCEVTLISSMTDPEQLIAKLSNGYTGIFSNNEVPEEKVTLYFEDQMRTKLHGPMEMLFFVFMVDGVSRALTHQLVRTRIASFVQESMRFLGQKNEYNVLMRDYGGIPTQLHGLYFNAAIHSVISYEYLVQAGVSSEDARGVLPTNILTKIFVGLPLNSLQHIYEQRMCCQAQPGEWQPMLRAMKKAVQQKCGDRVASLLSAPYERGEECGYRASYDRPCSWRKDGK